MAIELSTVVDASTIELSGSTLRVKDLGISTAKLAADAVTYAKMQNVSVTDRLLGRDTAAAGDVEELTVGGGLEFTGSAGIQRSALTGDVTASAGSGATTVATINNLATAAEVNRVTDVSTRIVLVGGTSLSLTEALHSDKVIGLNHTAATSTVTLPAATGSGARFRLIVHSVNTNSHIVKVANASDTIKGSVNLLDDDANAQPDADRHRYRSMSAQARA